MGIRKAGGAAIVIGCMASTCMTGIGRAQDTHYWSQHYGTESTLLNGAVIGSNLDLGAIYYNPGGLVLLDDYEFLLSADVLEFTTTRLKGLTESEPSTFSIKGQPRFVSMALPAQWLPRGQMAACYLKRQRSESRLKGYDIDFHDSAEAPGQLESSHREIILDQKLDEDWYGVGLARQLGPHAGLGVTQFLAVRSHRTRLQTTVQEMGPDGEVGVVIAANEFDYLNFRFLWKAGLALEYDALTAGLTVTTPSVNLFGDGSSFFNRTSSGFDIDGDGVVDPVYKIGIQDDLRSKYRSSWAVGIGAAYTLDDTRLHFSAEWFNRVGVFSVLDTKETRAQDSGEPFPFSVEQELKSVLNWGVGIEHWFGERLSAYGSFSTDMSSAPSESSHNLSMATWNLYQATVGTSLAFTKAALNLGLGYSFGSDTRTWPFVFDGLNEGDATVATTKDVKGDFKRIRLIFGFSFNI